MLKIARHQLLDGLRDAKYLFLATLIVLAFFVNGVVFSESYRQAMDDYRASLFDTHRRIEDTTSLQRFAVLSQRFVKPPSPLAFVADGGTRFLPNVVVLNVFERLSLQVEQRGNAKMPVLLALDWSFIVGVLMTLLTVLVAFSAVAGEKRSGTLRQVLSNPLSRLQLFAGKYLGLLAVLLVALILGAAVNLTTLAFIGSVPLTGEVFWAVGWAFFLAVLCVSAFLLTAMAVSSMTSHPPVALVVLLVIWVLMVVAVPGVARLAAEQVSRIPARDAVEEEQERVIQEVWNSYPAIIGRWRSNPFDDHVPLRAEAVRRMTEEAQKVRDNALRAQVSQALLVRAFSSPSPSGLLDDALQALCGTGVHGFAALTDNAERYRAQLHDYVVERDRIDPSTPHLVYGSEGWLDRGTFSRLEFPASTVPRAERLWTTAGLIENRPWPWGQMVLLVGYNLLAGLVAFAALMRYDPR